MQSANWANKNSLFYRKKNNYSIANLGGGGGVAIWTYVCPKGSSRLGRRRSNRGGGGGGEVATQGCSRA